jgi:putative membrane protein
MQMSSSSAQRLPQDKRLHAALWLMTAVVLAWSAWRPHDRFTWVLEVLPVFIGSAILIGLYPRIHVTRLAAILLCAHAIVLMVGGKYTYAEVPLFNWIRDHFGHARNHYDRVGHFMQGFVPAIIAREVLLRAKVLRRGGWLFFIVVSICLAISAAYELFEWLAAVATGEKADAFLGSQGDVWDTQSDMAMALIGSVSALLFLSRLHDRELTRFGGSQTNDFKETK